MRTVYVGTLTEGDRLSETFCLTSKEIRSSRTGEAYLAVELADRTGRIAGVMFRPDRSAQAVPVGSVVAVDGTATTYRGLLRVSVERLRLAGTWDATQLLPTSQRDPEELIVRLRELAKGIHDPHLARIVRTVFGDRGFMGRFKRCPGARTHHHAYVGGLLEHTVAVASVCAYMARLYPEIDHDLLIAGALLHDIGKVDELRFETGIDYTDEGRLIGHVVLGESRLRRVVEHLEGVPAGLVTRLSHVMLSHHGELEWDSSKRPCTLEALVLHNADMMDASTSGFLEAIAGATRVEEEWTGATNQFGRPLHAHWPGVDDTSRSSESGARARCRGA